MSDPEHENVMKIEFEKKMNNMNYLFRLIL